MGLVTVGEVNRLKSKGEKVKGSRFFWINDLYSLPQSDVAGDTAV